MTESDPDPHESTAAIILATGRTGRMQSQRATALHALAGRPMAFYAVQAAQKAGCALPMLVCTAETAQLRGRAGTASDCVVPKDGSWPAAALAAMPESAATLLVVSSAMPLLSAETLKQLVQCRQETSSALVLLESPHRESTLSGAISRDAVGKIARIVTDQGKAPAAATGDAYSLGVACVSRAWLWEHRNSREAQGEDCIASLAALAVAAGARVETVHHAGEASELLHIQDRTELALAESALRERIRLRAQRGGVTLIDPATVWIDDTVALGRDITILPNCHLYGDTTVGDNCTIGPNSRLQDTRLAANVTVMESVIESAEVGENVRIGPFAHLRPGTVIANNVEIGNYAELKNTRVSPGAKIHHVGYLGDTVVGSGVNVGAGTITCNYDGAEKHETELGDGAFIGSGTLLVAPVRVGSKAMTGAGSVVTRDVPPQAKAYGVPARVRGVRALPAEPEQGRSDEKRGA